MVEMPTFGGRQPDSLSEEEVYRHGPLYRDMDFSDGNHVRQSSFFLQLRVF